MEVIVYGFESLLPLQVPCKSTCFSSLFLFLIPLLTLMAGQPSRVGLYSQDPPIPQEQGNLSLSVAWRVFVSANQHMLFWFARLFLPPPLWVPFACCGSWCIEMFCEFQSGFSPVTYILSVYHLKGPRGAWGGGDLRRFSSCYVNTLQRHLVMSSHPHIKVGRVRLPRGMEGFSWEMWAASDSWGNPVLDSPRAGGKGEAKETLRRWLDGFLVVLTLGTPLRVSAWSADFE